MASEPLLPGVDQIKDIEEQNISLSNNDLALSATVPEPTNSTPDESPANENNGTQLDEDDDDYDPESAFAVPEVDSTKISTAMSSPELEASKTNADSGSISDADNESNYEPGLPNEFPETGDKNKEFNNNKGEEDKADVIESKPEPEKSAEIIPENATAEPESGSESEDYDPEKSLLPVPVKKALVPSLPPKPAVQTTQDPQIEIPGLQEAYEAVMQSEIVRLDHFAQLSKENQMEVIQELLREKQISLPGSETVSNTNIQANQIASEQNNASGRPYLDLPMTDEEKQAYENFLIAESEFLSSGQDLPGESRLFVGNLPTKLVKKEDLFRIFSRYGDLLEISIKAGFGFAQFKTNEACAACKKGEAEIPLYDRILRLDFSHGRKSAQEVLANVARGRERSAEDGDQESDPKRAKTNIVDVYILVTDQAKGMFVNEVEETLQNDDLTYSQKDIGNEDPAEEIREAAYLGVVGVCVIKDAKVDLQIFEETGDGGVKFDEYLDIDPSAACEIISNGKRTQEQRILELAKTTASKRSERSTRYKDGLSGVKHKGDFLEGRRGYPEKPYTNERTRGPGRQPWQRNHGFQGRPRNEWDRESQHSGFQGQGGNFYQGASGYDSALYQGPGYNNEQYGGNQQFQLQGRLNNQRYGRHSHQNAGGYQGHQRQNFGGHFQNDHRNYNGQMGFNGMSLQTQPPQPPLAPVDPALMQTLQNLDPNTMNSVVALLQQQGSPGPSPGVPVSNGSPVYPSSVQQQNYQQGSPSAQVNSLLAQLQSQPTPLAPLILAPFSQQLQPPQPYNNAPPQPYNSAPPQPYNGAPAQPYNGAPAQQPLQNEALKNMLSRLGGQ